MSASGFDMSALMRKYKRYWWLFLASLIVCLGMSVLYLKVKKPVYLIVSRVLVNQDDNATSVGSNILKTLDITGSGSKVDDELVVMGSQEICTKMISKLGINRTYVEKLGFLKSKDHYKTSPIAIDVPNEVLDTLLTSLKFNIEIGKDGLADIKVKKGLFKTLADVKKAKLPASISTPYGIFVVSTTEHYKPGKELKMKAVVAGDVPKAEDLMQHMTVGLISKKSNGIYLDVGETNIERGKDILNTVIELYNERGQIEKDEQAVNTGKFIDERLTLIYKDLTASEADIEDYKRAHNVVDQTLKAKNMGTKQLEAEEDLVKLEAQTRVMQMIRDFVSTPANKNSLIPFGAEEEGLNGSVKMYNNLVLERMKLANSATDDNEVMQNIDRQLEDARQSVIKGVNNNLSALKIQLASARAVSGATEREMRSMPTQEREIRNLYRQQKIQDKLYKFLLEKREENALLLAATTPKGKIVDHAYAQTEPVKPKIPLVLFLGLFAGLLIPVLLLWAKNKFTTKFATQEELQDLVKAPVIGEISHNRHRKALVVEDGKTSSIVELFRLLRNNLQFMLPSADDKVLLVTSSVSGEGKSFVATNLAASFGLLGKKVALVGLDIRSPKLAEMLNLNDAPGVTAYLSNTAMTLDDICQQADNMDVFVGGTIPPNPSELLLSDRAKQLFDDLRARYDVILVDSAPIALVSDTFSLSKFADASVYVTRANYTKRNFMRYLNTCIERKQLENVAVVINDTNPRVSAGYGYGYGKDDDKA